MKVLVQCETWSNGGIRTSIVNEIQNLSSKGMSFDLLTTWDWPGIDDSAIEACGTVHYSVFEGDRPNLIKRTVVGLKVFGKLLDENGYDAIDVNTANGVGLVYALVAKRHGVGTRLVHSHNTSFGSGSQLVKGTIHRACMVFGGDAPNARIACSGQAGRYLFGTHPFEVIKNGVDVNRFRFKPADRVQVRRRLEVPENTLLFGSIGRVAEQKNPIFQLRTFAEVIKVCPGCKYMFLGSGDLLDEAKSLAVNLGIQDNVIFLEPVQDAAPYYSALDALLLPSLYEGLPYVCIEAQCAGLPILMSDVVTDEAVITDLVEKMSLDAPASEWAAKLVELAEKERDRSVYPESVRATGFDVESSMERLREILMGE